MIRSLQAKLGPASRFANRRRAQGGFCRPGNKNAENCKRACGRKGPRKTKATKRSSACAVRDDITSRDLRCTFCSCILFRPTLTHRKMCPRVRLTFRHRGCFCVRCASVSSRLPTPGLRGPQRPWRAEVSIKTWAELILFSSPGFCPTHVLNRMRHSRLLTRMNRAGCARFDFTPTEVDASQTLDTRSKNMQKSAHSKLICLRY
jgi:hypothetical protein